MSETIEEVADEYQTYRVLSQDEDFELPITAVCYDTDNTNTCYLEVTIDDTPFYLEINTSKIPPHSNYAVLDALTGSDPVTKETLTEQTITVHIEEDLEHAIIKTDTTDVKIPITRDDPQTNETATDDDWNELDTQCAISTWYETADTLEEDKARETQISHIKNVTDDTIHLALTLGRATTTVHLPRPENADTESDRSAEFIEDYAGDIRLLEDETVILVPQNTYIKSKFDGFETDDELFEIYSHNQYQTAIKDYSPSTTSSSSSSSRSRSSSTSTAPLTTSKAQSMRKFGFMGITQWFLYKIFFEGMFTTLSEQAMASSTTETGTQNLAMMFSLIDYVFGLFLFAGILSLVLGVSVGIIASKNAQSA